MRVATVGELAEQIRGVTYAKTQALTVPDIDRVGILRAGNICDDRLSLEGLVYVPRSIVKQRQLLRAGDVLVATSSGSVDVLGKTTQIAADIPTSFGAFCKVLRPSGLVNPNYFGHFFRTEEYRRNVRRAASGVSINNLRNADLDKIEIPLPPIEEQRRIAAVLDAADALRAKRREAIAKLDSLNQAIFIDMFGDPVTNPKGWRADRLLAEVADVRSGLTKGRRVGDEQTTSIAFLAVVNVQDGFISLDPLKHIDATSREISRFELQAGDVLLTEGGDPDKLGRGAVWNAEVEPCIHQNHVFRVRLTDDSLTPEYLSRLIGSTRGKRYFLRMAKQTTGIASINMSQLRAFPVLEPPRDLQQAFLERARRVHAQTKVADRALRALDTLFASLQQRAFRGEL